MRERSLVLTKANRQKSITGDKTQTRRLYGLEYINKEPWAFEFMGLSKEADGLYAEFHNSAMSEGSDGGNFKAPWQVGDHLWMLEPYQVTSWGNQNRPNVILGRYSDDDAEFVGQLTPEQGLKLAQRKFKSRRTSGRFMYKSLARYWFEVTGVRVQLLRKISPADALAEGIETYWDGSQMWYKNYLGDCDFCGYDGAVKSYESLWDSINKKRGFGWDKNPWVWVYEYKKIEKTL